MESYSRSHLSDGTLLANLASRISQERHTTAELLADLGEVDERRLYAPAGFPSMYAYCLEELRFSEDSACKRIRAARAARQFPAIFTALAEGRLHLTGVVLLAPHLTPENADELLTAATHKSKSQIEHLIAERLPRPDMPTLVQPLSPYVPMHPSSETMELSAPGRIDTSEAPSPKISPLAPERFALQLTIGQSTHDKLRYAQQLLGHQVPSGNLAEVLERLLDLAIPELEKRKFAATSKPREDGQANSNSRDISAAIQRAVWQRDRGQCTFVSASGRRCSARARLEFDHIQGVARGGASTASNIRLLCRTHNQHAAERMYGPGFMKAKRQDSQNRVRLAVSQLGPRGCRTVSPHQGGAAAP